MKKQKLQEMKKIYTLSNNIADIREQIKGFTKPKTKTAGRRIRRWIAKEYMKKPGVEGFELLPSLTQVISMGGEEYYFVLSRLLEGIDKNRDRVSIISYLRQKRIYVKEWEYLRELLNNKLEEALKNSVIDNKDKVKIKDFWKVFEEKTRISVVYKDGINEVKELILDSIKETKMD